MGKVLVTEQHLEDIADAIRGKNGTIATYRPHDMAQAITDLEVYPEPTGTKSITENGLVSVKDYEFADVDVAGGGGSGNFPFVDEGYVESVVKVDIGKVSAGLETLYANYLHKTMPSIGYSATLDASFIGLDLDEFFESATPPLESTAEYQANVSSAMINDCGLDLLLDASSNSQSTRQIDGNFSDYVAVILNGIYYSDKTSNYNTTMIYVNPVKNKSYWTGMRDRNTSYDCYVTFTSETEVTLSGGQKHCVIYGVKADV